MIWHILEIAMGVSLIFIFLLVSAFGVLLISSAFIPKAFQLLYSIYSGTEFTAAAVVAGLIGDDDFPPFPPKEYEIENDWFGRIFLPIMGIFMLCIVYMILTFPISIFPSKF
jgi:hypothetical protein